MPAQKTVGALRATAHTHRTVKAEIRDNLVATMRAGQPRFPGMVGFADTVLPQLERALLAGHDLVLLGERGQGKTRLMRTLPQLLDEWTPVVEGCEINDHPYAPTCTRCRRLAAEAGDDLPIAWWHREQRYGEKLATPDTSVGDLVGDIDPVRIAEGRTLGDPETVHYGLVPRTNRGIFALNELPDLAERIQVGLFNVLEERDIQIRGYALRLPLDLILVASANPEDYTNRGRIITPLKDRFGAEIRTHYPVEPEQEAALIAAEAEPAADVPTHLLEVLARLVRALRESPSIDQRSGVSARFGIAAAEAAAAGALRRAAVNAADTSATDTAGGQRPVARIGDLAGVLPTLRGKVEFEMGEEEREDEVVTHLLRVATAQTFTERLRGVDLSGFTTPFARGETVQIDDLTPPSDLLSQLGTVPGLARVLDRLGYTETPSPGEAAAAVEFVLEGLFLSRRIAKDALDGQVVYGAERATTGSGSDPDGRLSAGRPERYADQAPDDGGESFGDGFEDDFDDGFGGPGGLGGFDPYGGGPDGR